MDIEIANDKGWCNLWPESDFKFVILALHNPNLVPLKLGIIG